jgi:hypothetical protein
MALDGIFTLLKGSIQVIVAYVVAVAGHTMLGRCGARFSMRNRSQDIDCCSSFFFLSLFYLKRTQKLGW